MNKKAGFSAVEIIVVVAVVAVMGGLAYAYLNRTPAVTRDESSQTAKPTDDQQAQKDRALTTVRSAYEPYLAYFKSFDPATGQPTTDFKPVLAAFNEHMETPISPDTGDPVLCAQNTPERISYGAPTLSGSTVTVPVVEYWHDSDTNTVQVEVSTKTGKISAITCTPV